MKKSTSNLFLGLIAGAATGAILGILYAPDKGTKTRQKIKDKSNELMEDVEERYEDLKKEMTDVVEDLKKKARTVADDSAEAIRKTARSVSRKASTAKK